MRGRCRLVITQVQSGCKSSLVQVTRYCRQRMLHKQAGLKFLEGAMAMVHSISGTVGLGCCDRAGSACFGLLFF